MSGETIVVVKKQELPDVRETRSRGRSKQFSCTRLLQKSLLPNCPAPHARSFCADVLLSVQMCSHSARGKVPEAQPTKGFVTPFQLAAIFFP